MITIFNRKELCATFDMKEQAHSLVADRADKTAYAPQRKEK